MAKLERSLRDTFRHLAFWIILAYVFLLALTAYGWTINARTLQEESRSKAAKAAAVQACIQGRPEIEKISRHVVGVNQLALVLVENNAAVVNSTPHSDPQYRVRLNNLRRLIRARENVKAISSFPVPTVAECRARGSQ